MTPTPESLIRRTILGPEKKWGTSVVTSSLQTKLIAWMLLTLMVAIGLLSAAFLMQLCRSSLKSLLQGGADLAQHLAVASRYSVLAGDTPALQRLSDTALAVDQVAYLVIMTEQGLMLSGKGSWLALSEREEITLTLLTLPPLPITVVHRSSEQMPGVRSITKIRYKDVQPRVEPNDRFTLMEILSIIVGQTVPVFYDIAVPILRPHPIAPHDAGLGVMLEQAQTIVTQDSPTTDGLIRLGISTVALQHELQSLIYRTILITVGLLLAAGILSVWFARHLTTPLQALTRAAARASEGDLSVRVATHGRDEVSRLTDVFNGMTASLESLTQSLELRVEERTLALAEANAKLQELDRRKSHSLFTTSHELRTPLTSMKLHLDNLLDGVGGSLTDKQTSVLQRIMVNIKRLQQFIEESLNLSRIESEQKTLNRDPVNPISLMSTVVENLGLVAQKRNIAIEHYTITAVPVILGDPAKLLHVFTNLIENAIKFSPMGSTVAISYATESPHALSIRVRDQGQGVDPSEIDRIFEPFYRGKLSEASIAGSGLGLMIAKHLVELHNGRLSVDNVIGGGACFTVTLPAMDSTAVAR
jgi:signal transduction histidine kinase